MGQLLSVPLPPNENLDPPLFISSFISFNPNNQHVKFERKCIKSSISMEVSWDDLSMHSFKNFESGTDEKNPEFVEFLKSEPFNATENCRNSREKIIWNRNSRDEIRKQLDIGPFLRKFR